MSGKNVILKHAYSKSQKADYNKNYYRLNKDYWKKWRLENQMKPSKVSGEGMDSKDRLKAAIEKYNRYMKEDYGKIRDANYEKLDMEKRIAEYKKNKQMAEATGGAFYTPYKLQTKQLAEYMKNQKNVRKRTDAAYGDIQKELALQKANSMKSQGPQAMVKNSQYKPKLKKLNMEYGDQVTQEGLASINSKKPRAPQAMINNAAMNALKSSGKEKVSKLKMFAGEAVNSGKNFVNNWKSGIKGL